MKLRREGEKHYTLITSSIYQNEFSILVICAHNTSALTCKRSCIRTQTTHQTLHTNGMKSQHSALENGQVNQTEIYMSNRRTKRCNQ